MSEITAQSVVDWFERRAVIAGWASGGPKPDAEYLAQAAAIRRLIESEAWLRRVNDEALGALIVIRSLPDVRCDEAPIEARTALDRIKAISQEGT